jgi:hypothetical protein
MRAWGICPQESQSLRKQALKARFDREKESRFQR